MAEPQASAPEAASPKRSGRGPLALRMLGTAGVALLAACGGEAGELAALPTKPGSLHLEPLILNLADPEGGRYLRVAIDIVVDRPAPAEAESAGSADLLSTRLRDRLLVVLASRTAAEVVSSEGKEALRAEVRRTAEPLLEEARVLDVYFTEFRVQ